MNTHQDNAQESNAATPEPTPHDPNMACTGLASHGRQNPAEGPKITAIGLSQSAPVDPHEVRARLTRRGSLNGLGLDGGTGVVFIPQHALPDLRRRPRRPRDQGQAGSARPDRR